MAARTTLTKGSFQRGISLPSDWMRLMVGLCAIFALFQGTAQVLGSDRGQAGLIVGVVVVAATLATERGLFGRALIPAALAVGFGRPRVAGMVAAGGLCLLLWLVPLSAGMTGVSVTLAPGSLSSIPGFFAQAGVAEEVLFRGYLFGHLRRGRSFWRAAGVSMIPFAAVHLLLFVTMPWPIALAALLLSVLLSVPLAHLFELGGDTIWAPALLHAVVQGTVKVIVAGDGADAWFPLAWMAASAVLPMFVLFIPRPTSGTRSASQGND